MPYATALANGEQFPPLILVGENQHELVPLEGHLRLTAHALAGFPVDVECELDLSAPHQPA